MSINRAILQAWLLAVTAIALLLLTGCSSPTVIRGLKLPSGAETQFSFTIDCTQGPSCGCNIDRMRYRNEVPVATLLGKMERKLHLSQVQEIEFSCPGGWQQVEAHYHFWASSNNFAEQSLDLPRLKQLGINVDSAERFSRVRAYQRDEQSRQEAVVLYELSEFGSLMQPEKVETGRERFVLILVHHDAR